MLHTIRVGVLKLMCYLAIAWTTTGVNAQTPGVPYMDLLIPKPIQAPERNRYADMLLLSEEQKIALTRFHEAYLIEDMALRMEVVEPLWGLSAEVAALLTGDGPSLDAYQKHEALFQSRDRAVDRLTRHDAKFLSQLENVLSEWQIVLLHRVQQRRKREHNREILRLCAIPGATIDMHILFSNLYQEMELCVADQSAFTRIMYEYEDLLTPLHILYGQEYLRTMLSHSLVQARQSFEERELIAQLLAQKRELTREEKVMNAALGAKQAYEAIRPRFEVAMRLYKLNRQYFSLLCEFVSPECRTRARAYFDHAMYPPVYPNPYAIDELSTALSSSALALNHDLLNGITALQEEYKMMEASLSGKMTQRFVDMREDWAKYHRVPPDLQDYLNIMESYQGARAANTRNYLELLEGILDPAQWEQLQPHRARIEEMLEAPIPPIACTFTGNPPTPPLHYR